MRGMDAEPQTATDAITNAVQAYLDDLFGEGHVALDWFLIGRQIDPDGSVSICSISNEGADEITTYGLASIAEEEARDMFFHEGD